MGLLLVERPKVSFRAKYPGKCSCGCGLSFEPGLLIARVNGKYRIASHVAQAQKPVRGAAVKKQQEPTRPVVREEIPTQDEWEGYRAIQVAIANGDLDGALTLARELGYYDLEEEIVG
jgi:hypothetical protein